MRALHVLLGALAGVTLLALVPGVGIGVVGAVLAAVTGVFAAGVVLGRARSDALALGALASLALVAGSNLSAAAGGALGVALLHGARARRARSFVGGALVLALAVAGGALAAALIRRHTGFGVEREISALVVAAALTALPFAIPTDDELAFRLRRALAGAKGVRRQRMLRALAIRRRPLRRTPKLEAAWTGMPAILSRASDEVARARLRALIRAERAAHALERAELAIGSDPAPFDAERQLAAELEAIEELATPRAD